MNKRKAIVTGASRGIGLAICQTLHHEGFDLVGIARSLPSGIDTGLFDHVIEQDLSNPDSIVAFATRLAREQEDADTIISCAGAGRFAPLESLGVDDIRYQLNLNLLAPMLIARAFVPIFKKRRQGNFVFIGSEAGHQAGQRGTAYSASKFGLRGFVKSLRIECASRGIRVCLINPGMTQTDFYAGQGFAPGKGDAEHLRAKDIADAVTLVLNAPSGTVFDEINLSPLNRVIDFKSN
ncbi:MAG: short-chain dehydrogenase [marine bacterium B5-7]|nr:MAG: short-chain dehydrogenase [marine bacterium B5-7]